MDSIIRIAGLHSFAPVSTATTTVIRRHFPLSPSTLVLPFPRTSSRLTGRCPLTAFYSTANGATNSTPPRDVECTVGDFMTRKEDLYVLRSTTTVDEALEALVEKKTTGFPVIDDGWNLIGVVSDYDLMALDSISGGGQCDINVFPDVDISWKAFNEIQKLLSKTKGKVVGDLMTPAPLVVREFTNLEAAVRLLLETKYHRLPVVDAKGKLIGMITRENVVRAAVQMKRAGGKS